MSSAPAPATAQVLREQTSVVRTRTYSSAIEIERVVEEIRSGKSTGQLSINFSQGGISAIIFEEFQQIS